MRNTLIALPGTLCDKTLFQYQEESLGDIFEFIIPNHTEIDNLKKLANSIISSIEGKFSILGLSYGGIIAFEIIRQAMERVNGLILLDTTHKLPTQKTIDNMNKFHDMVKNNKFESITKDILTDAMLHTDHAKKEDMKELVLTMAKNTGEQGFLNQVKSQLGRPDSTPLLPNIKCPTLIITGKQDNVCPLDLHLEMDKLIPNSTLETIDKCGHLSTIEQPQQVNSIIRKWWIKHYESK